MILISLQSDVVELKLVDIDSLGQDYNARKVILEVYASFVQQCTVSGRLCKHMTDVTA